MPQVEKNTRNNESYNALKKVLHIYAKMVRDYIELTHNNPEQDEILKLSRELLLKTTKQILERIDGAPKEVNNDD